MKAPAINYRGDAWRGVEFALEQELKDLDMQNRSVRLSPDETLRIRTRIELIQEMLDWPKPAEERRESPEYAVPQGGYNT